MQHVVLRMVDVIYDGSELTLQPHLHHSLK